MYLGELVTKLQNSDNPFARFKRDGLDLQFEIYDDDQDREDIRNNIKILKFDTTNTTTGENSDVNSFYVPTEQDKVLPYWSMV